MKPRRNKWSSSIKMAEIYTRQFNNVTLVFLFFLHAGYKETRRSKCNLVPHFILRHTINSIYKLKPLPARKHIGKKYHV